MKNLIFTLILFVPIYMISVRVLHMWRPDLLISGHRISFRPKPLPSCRKTNTFTLWSRFISLLIDYGTAHCFDCSLWNSHGFLISKQEICSVLNRSFPFHRYVYSGVNLSQGISLSNFKKDSWTKTPKRSKSVRFRIFYWITRAFL